MKDKFVKYLRVSTTKQGMSGLGLSAQSSLIDYFIRDGEIVSTFSEVYTGTDLKKCVELQKAIKLCKETGAKLILYKSDRFRNVDDALEVMAELGEGNLICCDIPNADRFTFILFFAIAEREALLISLRTKQALEQIQKDITKNGYHTSKKGNPITSLGNPKGYIPEDAIRAASQARVGRIGADSNRRRQYMLMRELRARGDNYDAIAATLNATGEVTPSGQYWSKQLVGNAIKTWDKFFNI